VKEDDRRPRRLAADLEVTAGNEAEGREDIRPVAGASRQAIWAPFEMPVA